MDEQMLKALQRRVDELAPYALRRERMDEFSAAMRALLAAYDELVRLH